MLREIGWEAGCHSVPQSFRDLYLILELSLNQRDLDAICRITLQVVPSFAAFGSQSPRPLLISIIMSIVVFYRFPCSIFAESKLVYSQYTFKTYF